MEPLAEESGTTVCKRCGQNFRCGVAAGEKTCWCFEMPHLSKAPEETEEAEDVKSSDKNSCYCPDCLKVLTAS